MLSSAQSCAWHTAADLSADGYKKAAASFSGNRRFLIKGGGRGTRPPWVLDIIELKDNLPNRTIPFDVG